MATDDLPLGAWEADRTVLRNASVEDFGDVADLPDDVKFTVRVARLVRRREQNINAEREGLAAFVLVAASTYEAMRTGRKEERLIHTGARRLTGRIHLVQAAATSSLVDEFNGDDSAMFARLAALGVANSPTLVYVPQIPTSSLSYYSRGTASDERVSDVTLSTETVTIEAIQQVIDAVHRQEFLTPDGSHPFKVWAEPSEGRPSSIAEAGVQQFLRTALAGRFWHCSIRSEQSSKVGRTDLEVVDDRTGPVGQVIHHALLELKVLRSRGESGVPVTEQATRDHIQEGVEQAHAYGEDKHTLAKMLCCFDMRDIDGGDATTFEHVRELATRLSVRLRRWFLYRSSAAFRSALAEGTAN